MDASLIMDGKQLRHRDIDRKTFARKVSERTNASIETAGHHPFRAYTASAWRHYTRRLALLDRLRSLDARSVLDVGCAEGFFMGSIAEARGGEVWGVDLSNSAVRVASTRYGLPVAAAQATALPFADGAFDLVYSTEVIEHVLDPEAMLAEMRRVARRHVVVTTPVSQTDHEHPPDYEITLEGHVNDFDLPAMQRLFGETADIRTFRNNSTFALLTAVGRHLPAGLRDGFYWLDLAVAKRWGSPHHRLTALRNRDWLIVTDAAATQSNRSEWRCPRCHGPLTRTDQALLCDADQLSFAYAAPGIPDFASESGDSPLAVH